MIILKLINYIISRCIRHIYWIYNLSKIKGISNIKISFPVIVEGKGIININSFSSLGKKSSFKIAKTALISLGQECVIDHNVDIRISNNASLVAGNRCSIGKNSQLYINNNWKFGTNANIATNCSIFSREPGLFGSLIMKNNSYIADNCIIDVADDIIIGSDVAIGPNCTFYTHDHEYHDLSLPAWNGKKTMGKITIGNKSWIGSNVTILPNVQIGQHVVIAAGSVVTKSIPDNTVWAGVPAKQINSLI